MTLAHTSLIEHTLVVVLGLVAAVTYMLGWTRGGTMLRYRAVSFCAGVAVVLVASSPRFESLTGGSFTAHMAQHLVFYVVAPPLFVVSRPVLTMTRLLPRDRFRALHGLAKPSRQAPILATVATIIVLFSLHLTPLYDWALRDSAVHVATHAALLVAGLLAWNVALRPGISDGPLRFGVAITLSVPIVIVGIILTSAETPLSEHYSSLMGERRALADQHAGGALMWIGSMVSGAGLAVASLWRWASREQSIANRAEALAE